MIPPCKGCEVRTERCHNDSCEKWRVYAEWKAKDRASMAKQIMETRLIQEYRSESHQRFLKEKWRKEK